MSNQDSNKLIARNTLFLYLRMGIVMLIALYTTRVVLRVLGNEDYGVYNVVCGFVAMFGIFNTSFSTCINRFYNYEIGKNTENGVRNVYNSALLIQFILAIAIVFIVEIVGGWYLENKMVLPEGRLSTARWIFHFSMFSMFLTVIQAPYSAAVMAYEKMDYYAIVSITDALVKLVFVIILPFIGGDKLLVYGILMCIIAIINFLMYFVYCKIMFPEIRRHIGYNKGMVKSMLSFSGWSLLDPASYMARDQGTNMVLNAFFGPIVNAAQGIAFQIASAVDSFSGSFATAFRPQIIQSYSEGQHVRTKNLMFSMSKISYLLQLMLVVPIIIEVNYILKLWLGEGYPSYAASFVCVILAIKSIGTLNTPISNVISATGNIRKVKVFSAIVISSVVPIAIVLFKIGFSPIFAYIALLILTIINQVGCVFILHKVCRFITPQDYIKSIIIPLLIHSLLIVAFPLLAWYLLPPSLWRLITVCFLSILATVLSSFFVVLNSTEKQMLRSFAKSYLIKMRLCDKSNID